ncbi:hypothetical protein D9757_003092 [Collybiopsis confluens]|uniref:Uracil-DNA glycosylase-like domain-containing protein n=1 Tax=Collybiopsis confluens TaxID=2823264 RepID=A0A8H5HX52_9AGAR|nr:hypothetical protein D9757_003092 [Collybiopsis confluens]
MKAELEEAEVSDLEPARLRDFQTSLSRFSFKDPRERTSSAVVSPTLESTRITAFDASSSRDTPSRKHKRPRTHSHTPETPESPSPNKKAKGKKAARGYASPEQYSHLSHLNDCLLESLDIVFCGINPGQRSAEIGHNPLYFNADRPVLIILVLPGHHFAHASNHFWKCLHLSGLTSERLPPTEDFALPDRFGIGLTNIVERPTAEATELKDSEFKEGIAPFLTKIARYRPRIACFIGLRTGRIVLDHVMRKLPKAERRVFMLGLQPYKIVHANCEDVPETLFYAVPSTSGKVQGYQIPDKVKLFSQLKMDVEKVKDGTLITTSFTALSW